MLCNKNDNDGNKDARNPDAAKQMNEPVEEYSSVNQ
jgi:hypothetical protein